MKNKKFLIGGLAVLLVAVLGGFYLFGEGGSLQGRFGGFGQADLVIQDISIDEDFKLTVEQANNGSQRATPSTGHTYVYIDGNLEWTYSWSTLNDTSFLRAGGSSVIQPQTLEGVHVVEACIDVTEVVNESNEKNNCLEVEVGPDLTASWLQHSPDPATTEDIITFGGLIWNDGNAPAPASTLHYYVGGSTYPEEISIPELQVGNSVGYEFEIVEDGEWRALNFINKVYVDVDDDVEELDETNNYFEYRYTVDAVE